MEFAQEVKFVVEEIETPTMIVNGVAQESQKIPRVTIKCPSCGASLVSFKEGASLVDVYKELGEQGVPEDMVPKYCPHCGTKLSCNKEIVNEQVASEV